MFHYSPNLYYGHDLLIKLVLNDHLSLRHCHHSPNSIILVDDACHENPTWYVTTIKKLQLNQTIQTKYFITHQSTSQWLLIFETLHSIHRPLDSVLVVDVSNENSMWQITNVKKKNYNLAKPSNSPKLPYMKCNFHGPINFFKT